MKGITKNKKVFIKSLLVLMILNTINLFSQDGKNIYLNTSRHSIVSNILKEERNYIISLPPSYDTSNNDYPVALLLDGDYHVHHVSSTIEVMNKEGQIPELIVVALETKENRTRDLSPTNSVIGYNGQDNSEWLAQSGGGNNFIKFIEDELLPEIHDRYRTKDYNMFVGHSLGGLMAAEEYLNNNESFKSFIAIDPSFWWDDDYIIKRIDTTLTNRIKNKPFYFSGANSYKKTNGMIGKMRNSHELFYTMLKNNGISHNQVKFQVFENENHGSVPLISLYHGLSFVFKDYFLDDIASKSKEEILKHYKDLSENMGVSFIPPENVINMVAWSKFNSNAREEAYGFFKMNIENYPSSHTAYEMLGYAYNNAGEREKAINIFEKAKTLNPNENPSIIRLLKELKNE